LRFAAPDLRHCGLSSLAAWTKFLDSAKLPFGPDEGKSRVPTTPEKPNEPNKAFGLNGLKSSSRRSAPLAPGGGAAKRTQEGILNQWSEVLKPTLPLAPIGSFCPAPWRAWPVGLAPRTNSQGRMDHRVDWAPMVDRALTGHSWVETEQTENAQRCANSSGGLRCRPPAGRHTTVANPVRTTKRTQESLEATVRSHQAAALPLLPPAGGATKRTQERCFASMVRRREAAAPSGPGGGVTKRPKKAFGITARSRRDAALPLLPWREAPPNEPKEMVGINS
jgi:hypothetical protein